MVEIAFIVQLIFNGIIDGSSYVLVALGLTLMFGILNNPNFAHGQVYMLGGIITVVAVSQYGIPFWGALIVATLATGVVGVLMDRLAFKPVERVFQHYGTEEDKLVSLLLVAFALYQIIGNAVQLTWGTNSQSIAFPIQGSFSGFGLLFTYDRLFLIVMTVVCITLLYLLVYRTQFGRAMRAIAQDEGKAETIGIDRKRISMITFFVGSALAGLTGGIIGTVYVASPFMGLQVILVAFILIVIAGMGSIFGVILVGYGIGIIENLVTGFAGSAFSSIVAFALLYVFLVIRPNGLFGSSEAV